MEIDQRAIRGAASGQHGVWLIPRRDFAIARIFEGKTVNGQSRLLVGTPQQTSGNHLLIVETLGRRNYDGPTAEYTVFNRKLKTSTGRKDLGLQANKQPDIAVVIRNGTVDLYEVQSGDQDLFDLAQKLRDMRSALPANNRGKLFLYDKDGLPIEMEDLTIGEPVIIP